MYFVFRWRAPCKAATVEGPPAVNIFNNNNYYNKERPADAIVFCHFAFFRHVSNCRKQ